MIPKFGVSTILYITDRGAEFGHGFATIELETLQAAINMTVALKRFAIEYINGSHSIFFQIFLEKEGSSIYEYDSRFETKKFNEKKSELEYLMDKIDNQYFSTQWNLNFQIKCCLEDRLYALFLLEVDKYLTASLHPNFEIVTFEFVKKFFVPNRFVRLKEDELSFNV